LWATCALAVLYVSALIGWYTVTAFVLVSVKTVGTLPSLALRLVVLLVGVSGLFLLPAYAYGQLKAQISDAEFWTFMMMLVPGAAVFVFVAKRLQARGVPEG